MFQSCHLHTLSMRRFFLFIPSFSCPFFPLLQRRALHGASRAAKLSIEPKPEAAASAQPHFKASKSAASRRMTDRLTKSLIIVYRLPCSGGFFKTSQKAWRISPVKGKNVMPFSLRFASVLMLQLCGRKRGRRRTQAIIPDTSLPFGPAPDIRALKPDTAFGRCRKSRRKRLHFPRSAGFGSPA